jgi:glutaryl-CoA dehydrogenase (non-decarboxylating)
VIYEGTSQLHTLIQADYVLGYREDHPLRRPQLPAQAFAGEEAKPTREAIAAR